jgi:hypothetical protein
LLLVEGGLGGALGTHLRALLYHSSKSSVLVLLLYSLFPQNPEFLSNISLI